LGWRKLLICAGHVVDVGFDLGLHSHLGFPWAGVRFIVAGVGYMLGFVLDLALVSLCHVLTSVSHVVDIVLDFA